MVRARQLCVLSRDWLTSSNPRSVIVLQMFIAVINENFEIAENSKKSRQASRYWAAHRPQETRMPWLRRLNPYRWIKAQPKAIAVEQLPSDLILPMQKTLVDSYPMQEKLTAGVRSADQIYSLPCLNLPCRRNH